MKMDDEANIIYGYHGKILRVNLTDSKITEERINEEFCRKYFGGAGFINYYLLKRGACRY